MEPTIEEIDEHEVLHSQAREVVDNIYKFMKKEACEGPVLIKQIQDRVAKATGISRRSVQRIMKEARNGEGGPRFCTPHVKRPRRRKTTNIDNFNKCVIRRIFCEFYHTKGHHPPNKTLLSVLRERINFKGSDWSLRYIINKLGFRRKKCCSKYKILIEKSEIREKRLSYLQALAQYKKEGRPVVYTYKMYIHSYLIIHAASEIGFIHNALFIFESDVQSDVQHNSEIYEHWLREKLIPNLPPKSVVVVDEMSYNVTLISVPTSSSRRADMVTWLLQHNIPFEKEMYKPELHRLIKLNKNKFTVFKLDTLLAEYGHSVLRLPKYHADLNPLDQVWAAIIKEFVADRINTLIFSDLINVIKEKLNLIVKDEWFSIYKSIQETEKNYLLTELVIDEATEKVMSDVASDYSGSSEGYRSDNSNSDMSGT